MAAMQLWKIPTAWPGSAARDADIPLYSALTFLLGNQFFIFHDVAQAFTIDNIFYQ
jgi:hypothetical protein